jgi:hypothetical protein
MDKLKNYLALVLVYLGTLSMIVLFVAAVSCLVANWGL